MATTFDVNRTPLTWTVEYKSTWAAGWDSDTNLFPTNVNFSLAPKISTAIIIRDYGRIHTLTSGMQDVQPLDLAGKYIKITLTKGDDELIWYGYCPSPADRIDGTLSINDTDVPRGRTTYSCFGLEWLLQDTIVSQCTKVGNTTVKRPLPFNMADGQRLDKVIGNRASNKGGFGIYEFAASANNDSPDWTGKDVIEHLLYNWYKQTGEKFEFAMVAGAGNALADLDNIKGAWDMQGKNYFQAINEIINPSNAFSYYVTVNEATNDAEIVIMPTVDSDIKEGLDTIVTANDVSVVLNIDTDTDIKKDGATVRHLDNVHYDEIEVRGGLLRTCFTISTGTDYNTDSVLLEGWESTNETNYKNSADDTIRAKEDFESVYTRFKMATNWNGLASSEVVFPVIDESTGLPDPLSGSQEVFLKNRVFDRSLPWTEIDNESQPRRPFAVYIDDDNVWHRIEKPGSETLTPIGLKMLDDELGIQLTTGSNPNHIVAKGSFSESTDTDPEWDYRKLLATVSMVTDEYARVVVDAPTSEPGELTRRKVIDVPHLQVWYVVPGTVKTIDPSQTGEDGLDLVGVDGEYARDDSAKLQRIALLAKNFYGKKRQIVDVTWSVPDIGFGNVLGYFISEAQTGEATQTIETIITEINYSLGTNTQEQQYKTDFLQIDFSKIGRISGGSGFIGGGFGTQQKDELANIPVRFAGSGGGGSVWTPLFWNIVQKNDTTITITNNRYRHGTTMGSIINQDVVIPTTTGTHYVYFEVLYSTSYSYKIETSMTVPDQSNEGTSRAFREELCRIEVSSSKISDIDIIWPGHIIAIDGRVV